MGKAPRFSSFRLTAVRALSLLQCLMLALSLLGPMQGDLGATQTLAGTAQQRPDPATRWLLLDAALAGRRVLCVGERGVILRSDDSGLNWKRCEVPPGDTLTGICFAPDRLNGWAVGHGPRLLSTSDGGLSWKNNYTHTGPETSLLDIACITPSHVIAVGSFGFAIESRDAGLTWTPLKLPSEDRHLNRIQCSARGEITIAGESGLLLRSLDKGETWQTLPSPYEGSFYGILHLSSGAMLAHGLRGNLLRSAAGDKAPNSGELPNWEHSTAPKAGLLATALQTSKGLILLAGQARLYLLSRDEGLTFTTWTPGITSAVAELLEAPDGSILAFGEDGVARLPAP